MFGERAIDKPGEVARIDILLLDSDAEHDGAEHSSGQFVGVGSAAELAVGGRLVEHVVDDFAAPFRRSSQAAPSSSRWFAMDYAGADGPTGHHGEGTAKRRIRLPERISKLRIIAADARIASRMAKSSRRGVAVRQRRERFANGHGRWSSRG
jgi:hypothetical protein